MAGRSEFDALYRFDLQGEISASHAASGTSITKPVSMPWHGAPKWSRMRRMRPNGRTSTSAATGLQQSRWLSSCYRRNGQHVRERNFYAILQSISSVPVRVNREIRAQSSWSPMKTRSGTSVVCASGQPSGKLPPSRRPLARDSPDEQACSSCALPRDTPIELVVRWGLRLRIEGVRSAVPHLPQRRTARRHETRR